jgi:hypothetical protein
LPLCDSVLILDNSIAKGNKVIATKHVNDDLKIEEPNIWREILEVANAK